MSGFLSRKYIQYRGLLADEPEGRFIDEDLSCTACGYNLRGLNYGRNCPECGQMIGMRPPGATADPLLAGDESERRLISIGLLIGAACLVVVAAARLVLFVDLIFAIGVLQPRVYLGLGFALSVAWCAACVLMIRGAPQRTDRWNTLATLAAWSQLLWLPGYVLFALRVSATAGLWPSEDLLHYSNLIVRGVAGGGALAVAYFMLCAAEDAELEDPARRLNTILWVVPILTVITAHIPTAIPWLLAIFIFLLLGAWVWFMLVWARAYWEMHRHIQWSARLAVEYAGRAQRIAERQRELQEQAESVIRPLSRDQAVVFGDRDRFCKYCQYNLRGLKVSSVCPECGKSIVAVD